MAHSSEIDVRLDLPTPNDLTADERRTFNEQAESIGLARILVIDPNPENARLLRSHIAAIWPDVDALAYDPSLGIPDKTFAMTDYEIVFLADDICRRDANGLDWLDALRQTAHFPPIIMLASDPSEGFLSLAAAKGAASILDHLSLGPRVLIETVISCLGGNNSPSGVDATVKLKSLPFGSEPVVNTERPLPKTVLDRPYLTEPGSYLSRGILDDGAMVEVPGYVIERRIARGNMGEVYLAHGHDDSELLALKILRLENEQNRETIQRFMREYQVVSELSNEHVITVYERGFGADFAFIAMEYCEYGNLKTKLRTPIPPNRALSCLRQVAAGLGAAHEIGVLHRDIKPANILFRDENTLVLTDFGVAKNLGNTVALTMTNSIVGSLYYVSPEQIIDDTCGPLSDLYSLGVVLYEMLVASPPYRGKSLADIMEAHCKAPIPRLSPDLRPLQPLVDGLLAKSPDERFQSTTDLIAGIDWVAESMRSG